MNNADSIYTGSSGWDQLQEFLNFFRNDGIFILVDENTRRFCLPLLFEKCSGLGNAVIIEIKAVESNKTVSGIETIWRGLAAGNAIRKSLLVCLGGGMVTDMGGFAAATFKRGIEFIHIPTTLLAMVDAAIGGKTGINIDSVKNMVGVFAVPKAVFIFEQFLKTLPKRQKLSGFAEMIKHAMISSPMLLDRIIALNSFEKVCYEDSIYESVNIKVDIVLQDPKEKGVRKVLNFGHTIGHAIESYSLDHDPAPLLHGEAIATGLICESFISMRQLGFDENELKRISDFINRHFPHYFINLSDANELLRYMYQDKKSTEKHQLNFTLLQSIGKPVWNQVVTEKLVRESLHFYTNLEIGFFV